MKRIHIDFAPRTGLRSILRTHVLLRIACCAAFIACVSASWTAFVLFQQRRTLESDQKRLHVQIATQTQTLSRKAPAQAAIPDAQASAVNRAVLQLNLPWRDVLDAIEAATPPAIALLTLDPDARRHTARIMAEAKTSADMVGYIETVKKEPFFTNVFLTRHETNDQDPNKPIRFQLEAQWAERQP